MCDFGIFKLNVKKNFFKFCLSNYKVFLYRVLLYEWLLKLIVDDRRKKLFFIEFECNFIIVFFFLKGMLLYLLLFEKRIFSFFNKYYNKIKVCY